jgi:hypothetical protein
MSSEPTRRIVYGSCKAHLEHFHAFVLSNACTVFLGFFFITFSETKIATSVTRGRCYDHNFLRFLTIFGEKMAFLSQTNVMIKILHNLALFQVKNANFLPKFSAKIFKKSVPERFRQKFTVFQNLPI